MSTLIALLFLSTAPSASTSIDAPSVYGALSAQVAAAYDTARGGLVSRSGIPHESAIELAFLQSATGQEPWKQRAMFSVEWTRGLIDTIGGGYFHAHGVRGPGNEALGKRTDSNALRLANLLRASQATGEERFRRDAARVVDFMERVLLDGRGGFVTAQVGDQELDPEANGVALHAWLSWSAARLDRRRRDFALQSLDRVWETSWDPAHGLILRNSFGEALREPRLLDQVEMGRAHILAYQLCGREVDRVRARQLGDLLVARFADETGGFRSASLPAKNGSIRKAGRDSRGNARAVRFLYELAALTDDSAYRVAADRAWAPFRKSLVKLELDAADWALAARAAFAPETPTAPQWAEAREPARTPRARSVRIKLGH